MTAPEFRAPEPRRTEETMTTKRKKTRTVAQIERRIVRQQPVTAAETMRAWRAVSERISLERISKAESK